MSSLILGIIMNKSISQVKNNKFSFNNLSNFKEILLFAGIFSTRICTEENLYNKNSIFSIFNACFKVK